MPNVTMDALQASLSLERVDDDTFTGSSLWQPGGRVYGGQVLAQALLAAGATVPAGHLPHSLHGYFLRPGDAEAAITFSVERLRDGRSFSARRTHAVQAGAPILSMITSFQPEQPGLDHQLTMPEAPDPESLPTLHESLGSVEHPHARFFAREGAFDIRRVEGPIHLQPGERTNHQLTWMRARGAMGDDQVLHRALLAYACDQVLLEPAMRQHGLAWTHPGMSLASLDHAMWWHRPVRVDEWLLYAQRSPSSQGGRVLGEASVFSQDGALVATIAQEGMLRVPD